jgi:hypothetical protein
MMNTKKPVMIGGAIGIVMAIIIMMLAALNNARHLEAIQRVVNFLASVPMFILAVKLKLPQVFQNLLFFFYWALIGGLTGWFLGGKKMVFKALAIIFLAALFFAHRMAQVNLEQELEAALRVLAEMFGGKIR